MVCVLIATLALGDPFQSRPAFRRSFYRISQRAGLAQQAHKRARSSAQHWDYGEDFDPRFIKNGDWMYGFYEKDTFNFHNDGWYFLNYLGKGLQAAANSQDQPQFGVQHVKNPRGNAVYFDGNLYWPPGSTSLHPGRLGEAAVVRFVAPRNGDYTFHYNFYPMDINVTTRAFFVFRGLIVDGKHGIRHGVGYSGAWSSIALMSGDTVDFCIDDSLNGNASDTTGFSLQVDVA